jgi:hypothetical protein
VTDCRRSRLVLALGSLALALAPAMLRAQPPSSSIDSATRHSPEERQRINDEFVQRLRSSIAGREREPASRVFKNIRFELFKTVPAADLLDIMSGGYSRALGVTCTHCHVETDFSSDEKRPKRAARAMAEMHRSINQALAKMDDLESDPEDRFVNCGTCHGGTLRPQRRSVR